MHKETFENGVLILSEYEKEILAYPDVDKALREAAEKTMNRVVKILIEKKGANINAMDENNRSALDYTIATNATDTTKLLLVKGAALESTSKLNECSQTDMAFYNGMRGKREKGCWFLIAGGEFTHITAYSELPEAQNALKERAKLNEISKLEGEKLLEAVNGYFSENEIKETTLQNKLDYFLIYACRSDNKELKSFGHCLEKILDQNPKMSSEGIKQKFLDACNNVSLLGKNLIRSIDKNRNPNISTTQIECKTRSFSVHPPIILTRVPNATLSFFSVEKPTEKQLKDSAVVAKPTQVAKHL